MNIGKLTNEELNKYIFKNLKIKRKESLQASAIGSDTAVLDFGDDLIVASVDPITGASKDLGILAVNVACNDIACQGAEPVGLLISALIPKDFQIEDLGLVMKELEEEASKLNVDIIGGHTEITDAVNKLILTVTSIGRIDRDKLIDPKSTKESDIVCISKDIAIEGTSIIYSENKEKLDKILNAEDKKELDDLKEFLSVLKESKIAMKYGVKYMHDVTEGGIIGGLVETANFLNKNISLNKKDIPIKNVSLKVADYFSIDPYKLISSGSMIFVFSGEDFEAFKEECEENKIKITKIGKINEGSGLSISNGKETIQVEEVSKDELYKIANN